MSKDENKIYIVTSGEYSEYSIDRVFSTRQKAMEYLDTQDDEARLEVFDLDEPTERKTEVFCVSFHLDKKKVYRVSKCFTNSRANLISISPRYFSKLKVLDIYVESDSRKRALKVASERYGAIIANEQTMYPYLRVGVTRHFGGCQPGYFDFKTGELVLTKEQELAVELPAFIKIRRLED